MMRQKILAVILLTLMSVCYASAQSSASSATSEPKVTVPLSFVTQAEKNADELRLRRAEVDSLKAQLTLRESQLADYRQLEDRLNGKITSLETTIANDKEIIAKLESNASLYQSQTALVRERLDDYRIQLDEAKRELSKARKAHKWWFLGGGAVGAALGLKINF